MTGVKCERKWNSRLGGAALCRKAPALALILKATLRIGLLDEYRFVPGLTGTSPPRRPTNTSVRTDFFSDLIK